MFWRRRKQREQDLDRELRSHLELEAEEHIEAGVSREEARYAARRAFGSATLAKENTREMWGWNWLERFCQDLRYSARTFWRTPGFTAAAVLSLGLGIGANSAIFSLLNTLVLRLLPVSEPQQLVQFAYTFAASGPNNWNSYFGYPHFERFQEKADAFSGIFGGTRLGRVNINFRGASELAVADAYSGNFFSVLGIAPQYGRFFSPGEDRAAAPVAVLTNRYWRNQFGADPSAIGSAITINEVPFTVIGVSQPEFSGITVGSGPDVWVPLHALDRLKPDSKRWTESFASWMLIAGRLRPGVSLAEAQAQADVIHRQLIADQLSVSELRNRESMQRFVHDSHLLLRPAKTGMYSGLRTDYAFSLQLLMCVAGIVLLVACANVANLLLARASNRRREIAVKIALGAGRGRVVQQLLTESLLLASMGGAFALVTAWWGSTALVRMISTGDSPAPLDVHPDWRIFGFTAAVSLLTGILFGLAPALRGTRVDPSPAIKEGMRLTGRSSRTLDRLLVIVQVGLSVVLISGAGLFMRTLQKLWSEDLGFDRENVLLFSVDANLAAYPKARAGIVYREILQRLQALPVVRSASASIVRPVDDYFDLIDQIDEVDGRKLAGRDVIAVAWNAMSPGYFSTVLTPILLGRDFDWRDNEARPQVVIVNETLARRVFPGQNPIGHRLGQATVIGVVKDSHYGGPRTQPRPVLYRALFQADPITNQYMWGFPSFELHYRAGANQSGANLVDEARHEVSTVDRRLPIFRVKTLREQTEQSLLKERLLATVSSFFGALGLLLACVGLYGLMAYTVVCRTGEIGIRKALGARRDHIIWLVQRETLCLVLAGIVTGIPLALWAERYTKSLLFGIGTADPLTIAGTIAALTGAVTLAGYLPARHASRVDPMVALRYE